MSGLISDITFNPIIPIPIMAVFCVVLIVFKRRGVIPYIRQILTVLLLFVINLRPMYPADNIRVEKQTMELNVIIVIDDTISMLGNDQNGYDTRLDRAKADVQYLLENLPGAKFSVICFNNNTHVLTPFTDNINYVQNAIDAIYPLSPTYATGTNISVCYDTLEDIADRAHDDEDANTVVFFMTDGENTDGVGLRSFDDIAEYIDGGAVMGYGTERGGHMQYYDDLRNTYSTVLATNGSEAVTKLDEDNLNALASDLGVQYLYMNNEGVLDTLIEGLTTDFLSDPEEEFRQGYVDIYYWFMIPLAALVTYEFISLKRRG